MSGVHPWSLRVIHWLVALCVLGLVPVGMLIEGYQKEVVEAVDARFGGGTFNTVYDLHKSVGLTVLGLMVLRVVVRATLPTPAYHPPLTPFERAGSRIVHTLLYLLLILTPIVGWVGVSAFPAPAPWFFLVDLRLPIAADRELSETLLHDVHAPLAWLIVLLAAAHVLAVLKHRFVNRDGVMRRMTG